MNTTVNSPFMGLFNVRPGTTDAYAIGMIDESLGDMVQLLESPMPTTSPRRILDIGGFIGTTSRAFKHLHPNAEIVAIEAHDQTFELLYSNSMNGSAYKAIHAGVVGRSVGSVWSASPNPEQNDVNYTSFTPVKGSNTTFVQVQALRIQDVLDLVEWGTVDFVKIDIEGGEYDLFTENPTAWLDRVNNEIHIEFHKTDECHAEWSHAVAELTSAGFVCTQTVKLYGLENFIGTRWLRQK
jgi:FkbM family methyltransferase